MTVVQLHPAAAVADAVKVYGIGATQVRALDHVTVEFPARRFTAIMGPSGSGKSTLMHCAAGLDTLTAGSAHIGGTELGTLNDRRLTELRRERIGFVFQAFNLVPTLTVRENITLPLDLAGKAPDAAWVDALVDVVGLGDRLHHRPAELSGGQQQRVAVARALAGRPQVVFADEPTGNLDSRSGAEVLGLLRQAVDTMGQAVVMVTHDPTAAGYADRALFLADGRLVDSMDAPTADLVLDRMKAFDTPAGSTRATALTAAVSAAHTAADPATTEPTAAAPTAATPTISAPTTVPTAATGPRGSDRR
ncbi:ABC transporter ATP-binding protein [Kitasatospora arboriphila]|uniref:ABC transporter ATP-binding protein n=1 Tax=Kitasatospora arboriphila TaxID=258052 RepID=A0ABP4E521_9ACTN